MAKLHVSAFKILFIKKMCLQSKSQSTCFNHKTIKLTDAVLAAVILSIPIVTGDKLSNNYSESALKKLLWYIVPNIYNKHTIKHCTNYIKHRNNTISCIAQIYCNPNLDPITKVLRNGNQFCLMLCVETSSQH